MRNKFAKFIDGTILCVVVSVIVFAWLRFYTKNVWLSLVIGIIIGLIITCVFNIFLYNREEKIKLNKQQKSNAEQLCLNLLCASNEKVLEYFANVLSTQGKVTKKQNYLIFEENSTQNEVHSTLHSTCIIPNFSTNKFSIKDFYNALSLINEAGIKDIKIFAPAFDDEVKILAKQINNYDFDFVDSYKFYSNYAKEIEFEKIIDISKPKLNYKGLLKFATEPKRAKNYLLFGLLIILMSFIVPFKLYYLILGSVLCVLALILKIIPLTQKFHKANKT